ncbi:hypothetical protein O1611_g6529 [Lasiodiplodia mahajangana]|uniref:Uncharacterized protein n=1 Tax=Lasiodiplodia mahajangana TaxID=1108764 RepID=A0ACC2JIQ6_9PEZI|nr:hypothetical protein O1611_g6529 [Lasiodiplodia mahajangana]
MEDAKNRGSSVLGSLALQQIPRFARTIEDVDTLLPSGRETRVHSAAPPSLQIRYIKIDDIGSGRFGPVAKAVDVDSGRLMAVKILQRPAKMPAQE